MVTLNLNNIEELLLSKVSFPKVFPEFSQLYGQWKLSKMTPGLRSLGQRTALELLSLLEPRHIPMLSILLCSPVAIQKGPYGKAVRSLEFSIEDIENKLQDLGPEGNPVAYRDEGRVYITFWK